MLLSGSKCCVDEYLVNKPGMMVNNHLKMQIRKPDNSNQGVSSCDHSHWRNYTKPKVIILPKLTMRMYL